MREAFLRALVLFGVAAVLITESLSLFTAITPVNIAIAWCCCAVLTVWYWRTKLSFHMTRNPFLLALVSPIVAISAIVGLIAVVSPPNSADAMAYHIPRVIYWAQQHSVRFFPTSYLNQIMLQPIAEYMMLQLYELTGGDRFLNLVQFIGFAGSILGVSSIAKQFGLSARGQLFASLFCATLPAGILQASGAKNDCLLALWLVCMVYFAIRSTRSSRWSDYLLLSCSAGLALGTKATAYLFAPFLLLAVLRPRAQTLAPMAAALLGAILVIDGPQFARNFELSHSLLGFDSAQGDGKYRWRNERLGWKPTVSNLLRHTSDQLGMRSDEWNQAVYTSVLRLHQSLGIDAHDSGTTWPFTTYQPPQNTNHEANANNHWHLLIFAAAVLASLRKREARWLLYSAALLCSFLAFCFYLKWQPFASRLELPLFVIASPLGGFLLQRLQFSFVQLAVCLLLVNNARPPVFENWTRPLKGPHSILLEPRDLAYFNDMTQWNNRDSYFEAADQVIRSGCKNIGININYNQLEYPFQALVRERMPDALFVHAGVTNASVRYYPAPPHPCAVLCIDCPGVRLLQFDQ